MGCGGSRSIEEIEQANDIEDRQKSSNGTIRRVSGHSQSVSLPFVGFLGNLKTLTINLDQFSNCMINRIHVHYIFLRRVQMFLSSKEIVRCHSYQHLVIRHLCPITPRNPTFSTSSILLKLTRKQPRYTCHFTA